MSSAMKYWPDMWMRWISMPTSRQLCEASTLNFKPVARILDIFVARVMFRDIYKHDRFNV